MRHAREKSMLVSVLAAIFLTIAYVAIGFGVCAGIPSITEMLAEATIEEGESPFPTSSLVDGALAVRDYSFGAHDIDALYETIHGMNEDASTPYAEADAADLMSAPSAYSLGIEEISHLDDVQGVASSSIIPIFGIAILAVFLLMVGLQFFGVEAVRHSLLYSGIATIALIAVAALWAIVSFDGLFYAFHGLFFDGDTWLFPPDSLLITMLPEAFWVGMGMVWASTSVIVGALSALLALLIRSRRKRLGMIASRDDLCDGDA